MKYKFILSTIVLFFLTSCTEQKTENDLTKANLKGKVKFTKETPYEAIEKFGEAIKGNVYIKGHYLSDYLWMFSSIQHTIYNELGFVTEAKDYDANGNTLKRSVYNYDDKGKLINYSSYNPKGLESKYTYKYDDKGNQIEWNDYNFNGELKSRHTYKYDDKGNQIEWNNYNSDGELGRKYTFKYDDKGNQIERNDYNFNRELESRHTYKYDDKGNQIEWNDYNSDGELGRKYIYKYDDKGNLIEWNYYSSDGELNTMESYKYKYDQKGNWIEKIKYLFDIPEIITEREIEYYQ